MGHPSFGLWAIEENAVVDTSLAQLEQMFRNMKDQSGWNINGDLLWGYFFTDQNPQRLEPLGQHLSELGYRFVSNMRRMTEAPIFYTSSV